MTSQKSTHRWMLKNITSALNTKGFFFVCGCSEKEIPTLSFTCCFKYIKLAQHNIFLVTLLSNIEHSERAVFKAIKKNLFS